MQIVGDYAFITIGGDNILQVIDVSDPYNLKPAGYIRPEYKYLSKVKYENGTPGVKIHMSTHMQIVGNYAFISSSSEGALQVFDISDPYNLKPAGFIQSEFDLFGDKSEDGTLGVKLVYIEDMQIVGDFAFITASGDNTLQVVDISDPHNLKPAGFIQSEFDDYGDKYEDGTPGVKLQNPVGIQIVGDFAFIIAGDDDALQVIDITDPHNLKPAGFIQSEFNWREEKYVGGTPRVKLSKPEDIQIVGDYAFIITDDDSALQVIDITDPYNLKPAGFIQSEFNYDGEKYEDGTPGVKLRYPKVLKIVGNYAFITASGDNTLQVVDISDPHNLKPAGFIQSEFDDYGDKYEDGTPGVKLQNPVGIQIVGDFAFIIADDDDALQVIDISDPTVTNTVNPKTLSNGVSIEAPSNSVAAESQRTETNTVNANTQTNSMSIEASSNLITAEKQPSATHTVDANTQTNSLSVGTPSNTVSSETHSTGKSNSASRNVNYYPVSSNKLTQSSKNNFKVDEDFVITLSDDGEHEFKIEVVSSDSFTASINGQSKKLENGVEYDFGEYKITPQVENNEVKFQIEALNSIGIAKESTLAASKQTDPSSTGTSTSSTDQGEDNKTKFYWFGGAAIAAYLFFHKKDPASGLNKMGKGGEAA